LHDMLADCGFDVVGLAEDGAVAVATALELRPDIVLMDIRMPGKNGIDATREILQHVPGARVIALSAYDDPALASAAADAGAAAYLIKGTARSSSATASTRSAARPSRGTGSAAG